MSLMSKSTALTVYKATYTPDAEALLKAAFNPIDTTSDALSFGFVNIDDYMDNSWKKSPPEKGRFMAFSLRIDTRRIPGAVLKKKYKLALEAELADSQSRSSKKFISKDRKQEIKDQVTLRLLAKMEPAPAVFDVVVDPTENTVLLCSASKSVKNLFQAIWGAMFDDQLIEQTPDVLANGRDLLDDASGFLTDVFTKTMELTCGRLFVPNKAVVVSDTDKAAMTLEAPESIELTTLSAPLTDGKVVKATIVMEAESGAEFTLTTRAGDLGITGLKTPIVKPDSDDPDGAFLEKVFLVSQVVDILHTAYKTHAGVITTSSDF